MSIFSSYSKIYNLGHSAINDLLYDNVIVQEKIDGSFIGFGVFNGELKIRSKGKEIILDAPEKMFDEGVNIIKQLFSEGKLTEGYMYCGEYLKKPHHNVLAYDRIPKNHIILFDIRTNIETYMPYADVVIEAERLGLEVVPLLHEGVIVNIETLKRFLDSTSVLGGQKIEGYVIKNYKRFTIDGKVMMGKYVSEAFREVHKGEWKKSNPTSGDLITDIITSYRTPARMNKAIQHLAERGELTNSVKDIGNLIKEVHTDIIAECKEEIAERLWKHFWPQIARGIVGAVPTYYKDKLLELQPIGKEQTE